MKIGKVVVDISTGGISLILAWISFNSNEDGWGLLFLVVGIGIALFAIASGDKSG